MTKSNVENISTMEDASETPANKKSREDFKKKDVKFNHQSHD